MSSLLTLSHLVDAIAHIYRHETKQEDYKIDCKITNNEELEKFWTKLFPQHKYPQKIFTVLLKYQLTNTILGFKTLDNLCDFDIFTAMDSMADKCFSALPIYLVWINGNYLIARTESIDIDYCRWVFKKYGLIDAISCKGSYVLHPLADVMIVDILKKEIYTLPYDIPSFTSNGYMCTIKKGNYPTVLREKMYKRYGVNILVRE